MRISFALIGWMLISLCCSRDDKRYTEKKNKSERARRKKEDTARLRGIVDTALAVDPRIKRIRQEEKEAREAKKKGKGAVNGAGGANSKQKAEEEKRKAEEEAKKKEEEDKVRVRRRTTCRVGAALRPVCRSHALMRRRRRRPLLTRRRRRGERSVRLRAATRHNCYRYLCFWVLFGTLTPSSTTFIHPPSFRAFIRIRVVLLCAVWTSVRLCVTHIVYLLHYLDTPVLLDPV